MSRRKSQRSSFLFPDVSEEGWGEKNPHEAVTDGVIRTDRRDLSTAHTVR